MHRRFAARHRRTAVAGTALFAESLLVAARAPLRRSARLGAGVHVRHRRGSFRSAVRQCRRRRLIVLLLILALTTLSATQDIAIDSYSVGLINREEEGAANGVRASAYRVALVFVGGGLVFLAGGLAVEFVVHFGRCDFRAAWLRRAGDSAAEFAGRSARALVARLCRLGRHLARHSAGRVRSDLQARRVCHRTDGQTVLGRLRQDRSGRRRKI